MVTEYVLLKFLHVLIAIIALGTSAALGIIVEFYGNHPTHGPFVLRMIRRLIVFVVAPGYLLMLGTGLWLTHLSWSFTTGWIRAALALWIAGALLLGISLAVLRRQTTLLEASGPSTAAYWRVSLLERILGGGVGLVVVAILYLMIFKPAA